MEKKWIPFWLSSSKFVGLICSERDWLWALNKYGDDKNAVLSLKSNSRNKDYPDFGNGQWYTASPTLGEWAKQNGLEL